MNKLIILGSGAAPGVPSVANGWGVCNPDNPKNRRRRTGTYIEINGVKLLIDTSPDLRAQLLDNEDIRFLDGVLYTHSHADHLHGIDDLRDLNRLLLKPMEAYANEDTSSVIKQRFPYLVADRNCMNNPIFKPSIILNTICEGKEFFIKGLSIMPIGLKDHPVASTGYIINRGEVVYIADCRSISPEGLKLIPLHPKFLIMPLTTLVPQPAHMGLEELLDYVKLLKPETTIINHMAIECDYDDVNDRTPQNVIAAYDNMRIEFE